MADQLLGVLHTTLTSPWVYVVLFALTWLDGFFPIVPGETALVTAAVFAVSGTPHWAGVVAVCALGGFAGDHTAYAIGHRLRGGAGRWASRHPRRAAALAEATRTLHRRGGLLVLVGRFVPGGRMGVTTAAGLTAFPLRQFTPWVAAGALAWSCYGTAIGWLGGAAFEKEPLKAVALGLGLALGIAAFAEAGRWLVARRAVRRGRQAQAPVSDAAPGAVPGSARRPAADTLVR